MTKKDRQYRDSYSMGFFGFIGIFIIFLLVVGTREVSPEEEETFPIISHEELVFPYQTGDTVSDLERLKFLDSLLLEDVKETYGFQDLQEYFEKHDSIMTMGTEYHYQYINKNK
jgi:uncharacterized protein YpmS